jgi:hypothetical protein
MIKQDKQRLAGAGSTSSPSRGCCIAARETIAAWGGSAPRGGHNCLDPCENDRLAPVSRCSTQHIANIWEGSGPPAHHGFANCVHLVGADPLGRVQYHL